ncbi:Gfo/Idh/MocA family oxidoreductase [Naasia aerilata]|uniref:Gfo/Idh/MocA-like oxidoreductase N-terminal domain-containing protein n=1 Tax=Naasia aerilata TaxID=1162966 RepID=A0ABM8G9I1_9MICO|nr:Gfo/Idh/MocA family oxidoreductase [Naasia aerilata]BDZ44861.1 hypothetical protein GCM10025866_07700 [Naasia aerilata]
MENRPLRLVVVGLGAVAQSVHLPLVVRRPDLFTLVGLVDLSPGLAEAIGNRYGIAEGGRGTDLEAVLDAVAPDALLIAAGDPTWPRPSPGFGGDWRSSARSPWRSRGASSTPSPVRSPPRGSGSWSAT